MISYDYRSIGIDTIIIYRRHYAKFSCSPFKKINRFMSIRVWFEDIIPSKGQ